MTKQHIAVQEAEVSVWLQKIAKAENAYRDYHKLLKDIRRYYRNEIRSDKQNIFWSSIETLKPFLYFKCTFTHFLLLSELTNFET